MSQRRQGPVRTRFGLLIGITVAMVLALVAAAVALGFVVHTSVKSSPPAPIATASASSGPSGVSTQPPPASALPVQVTKQGFSQLPADAEGDAHVTYGVLLRNPRAGQAAMDVRVLLTFTTRAGTVLDTKDDQLDVLLPGQTGAVGDDTKLSGVATMRVTVQVGSWVGSQGQNQGQAGGQLQASGVRTVRTKADEVTTFATVRSTFTLPLNDVEAVAVYYNAAGRVIGGASDKLDTVAPNGQAPVSVNTSSVPPGLVRTELYTVLSGLPGSP